jgi:hypothetical protein
MSMRIIKFVTRLRAEDAYTLIEFLDEVRDALMQTYGAQIRAMLQHATTRATDRTEENPPF